MRNYSVLSVGERIVVDVMEKRYTLTVEEVRGCRRHTSRCGRPFVPMTLPHHPLLLTLPHPGSTRVPNFPLWDGGLDSGVWRGGDAVPQADVN